MNKKTYLDTLQTLLSTYDIPKKDIEDIISDYASLWEECEQQVMTQDDIISKLGKPDDIIGELTEGYQKLSVKKARKKHHQSSKLIAITPFIALPLFFLLGFTVPGAWTYAWLAFLIIPMTAIITQGPQDLLQKLTALSPFIALFIFFLILGPNNLWYPGWIIFLLIPAIGILNESNIRKKIALEALLLLGVFIYLYWVQMFQNGQNPQFLGVNIPYAELALLPFVLYLLVDGLIKLSIFETKYLIIIVISITLYVWISVTYNLWVISWLIFFIFPVYTILSSNTSDKIIAIMPFISTSLFMLLGYFFNWWAFAWLVFLLIPVTAILKGK